MAWRDEQSHNIVAGLHWSHGCCSYTDTLHLPSWQTVSETAFACARRLESTMRKRTTQRFKQLIRRLLDIVDWKARNPFTVVNRVSSNFK